MHRSPEKKKPGWMWIRLNPIICSPCSAVSSVFSHRILAEKDNPSGAATIQISRSYAGKGLSGRTGCDVIISNTKHHPDPE